MFYYQKIWYSNNLNSKPWVKTGQKAHFWPAENPTFQKWPGHV